MTIERKVCSKPRRNANQLQLHSLNLHYLMCELPSFQAYYCGQMGTKACCNYSASPVGEGSFLRELNSDSSCRFPHILPRKMQHRLLQTLLSLFLSMCHIANKLPGPFKRGRIGRYKILILIEIKASCWRSTEVVHNKVFNSNLVSKFCEVVAKRAISHQANIL